MGSIMKSKIHIIEVENNETQSIEKIIQKIKENKIKFDDNFEIKNKLPFDTKENVEINFLLWVDGIPPEKLVPLPSDYHSKDVKYGEESIEVLEVNSY